MPFVKISDSNGNANIWWSLLNPPNSKRPNDRDVNKPVLIFLPPVSLDTSFMGPKASRDDASHVTFNMAGYADIFNIIAIETRFCANTKCKLTRASEVDASVMAVDIALVLDALVLPPVHVYASGVRSGPIALHLACLFPERVASIICDTLGTLTDAPETTEGLLAIAGQWLAPEDEGSWSEATMSFILFAGIAQAESAEFPDLVADRIATESRCNYENFYWRLRTKFCRQPIGDEALHNCRTPLLILEGSQDLTKGAVNSYASRMPNVKGHVQVQEIAGGGHFMFETHADIIFEAAKRFYLQHVDGTLTPIKKTNFDEALHRLPAIAGRPLDLKKRKSRDPFSYSLVTEEAQEEALVMLDEIRKQRASVPFDIPFGDKKLDYHRDVEQIKYRFSHR